MQAKAIAKANYNEQHTTTSQLCYFEFNLTIFTSSLCLCHTVPHKIKSKVIIITHQNGNQENAKNRSIEGASRFVRRVETNT